MTTFQVVNLIFLCVAYITMCCGIAGIVYLHVVKQETLIGKLSYILIGVTFSVLVLQFIIIVVCKFLNIEGLM